MIVKITQFYALTDIPHTALEGRMTQKDGTEVRIFSFIEEKKDTFFHPPIDLVNKFVGLQ